MDENCGADGWALTPSGMRGVLNDAVSLYFADATLASAFVARWCVGSKVETAGGVFQVREDEPVAAGRGGTAQDAVRRGRDLARRRSGRPDHAPWRRSHRLIPRGATGETDAPSVVAATSCGSQFRERRQPIAIAAFPSVNVQLCRGVLG
jgi:hypothetical protein